MKAIELTQGYVALVDDDDYEYINQWNWQFKAKGDNQSYDILYARRKITLCGQQTEVSMHHQILKTTSRIKHINQFGLDNRKANLQIITRQQAQHSRRKQKFYNGKPTSSKYKGVSWCRKFRKWHCQIHLNSIAIHLGYFPYEQEAQAACKYDLAAIQIFGDFANTNFPVEDYRDEDQGMDT